MNNRIIICGGGLMGLSVAYNLAKRGAKDLYLFERNCVGAQNATRAITGLLTSPIFYSDPSLRSVVRESFKLYTDLAINGEFKFTRSGRVYLTSSDDTAIHARRLFSRLLTDPQSSSEAEYLDCPSEMLRRWPMLATEDLKLAVYSPLDATIDVPGLCRTLADRCKELGVQLYENCGVKKVLLNEENQIYAVDTDEGFIDTTKFVNAAGIWASLIEVMNLPEHHVRIAAHPCCYTLLSTDPLPHSGFSDNTPVFICMDENTYICPTESRTICGGFVEQALKSLPPPTHTKLKRPDWHVPPANWDNFRPVLRDLINRCPPLAKLPRGELILSAEMYTPDMRPLIGESDQARGYFVANGLNAQGLPFAGGLGCVLADWILAGQPPSSMIVDKMDLTRFLPLHSNPQYLFQRVSEVASNIFKNLSSNHQCHTARNLRTSPIHHHLREAGAVFAEIMGYERPLWYDPLLFQHESDLAETPPPRQSMFFTSQDPIVGKPRWFPLVAKEYETCRERVGLIDMTSFSKFDLNGPDVVPLLQRLCSGNIDRPIGTSIYTGMQNEWGGYVTDTTVSRMGNYSFFLVAPTIQQTRLALWIQRWAKEWKMDVHLQDVTNAYTALDIVGPESRNLLKEVTGEKLAPSDFPSFSFRELHIGVAGPIRMISVTHCGELGWMLYIPNEIVQNVYEQLIEAGTRHGLRHCGYYALRHLRIEKFYVYWGQDIDSSTTPVECGRVFRVDFDKEFIGKEAIQRQLERGIVNKQFVQLLLDKHDLHHDQWPQGEEPIYRNGKLAGWTTTAAYGFTLGCHVCLGYVENYEFGLTPEFLNNGHYEVELAGKRFPCRLSLHSPTLPMISSEHPHHYRPTQ